MFDNPNKLKLIKEEEIRLAAISRLDTAKHSDNILNLDKNILKKINCLRKAGVNLRRIAKEVGITIEQARQYTTIKKKPFKTCMRCGKKMDKNRMSPQFGLCSYCASIIEDVTGYDSRIICYDSGFDQLKIVPNHLGVRPNIKYKKEKQSKSIRRYNVRD